MEEEKSILDATEYVLVALNNIKSFDDFNDYKEDIHILPCLFCNCYIKTF